MPRSYITVDPLDRLMANIVVESTGFNTPCWLSNYTRRSDGYTKIDIGGKTVYCHRFAFERLKGPVPDGLTLDRLCRIRHCVNPDHLDPVTRRVNTLRGESPTAVAHVSDICKWGHDLGDAYQYPHGRQCRTCTTNRTKIYRQRKKERLAWTQ